MTPTTERPLAPSHYSTIQIGKALHQVPAHIVASIGNMVKPYDEFKTVLSASPETVKAQELAADRNTELIDARAEIERLTAKVAELRAGGDSGEGRAETEQPEAPTETAETATSPGAATGAASAEGGAGGGP